MSSKSILEDIIMNDVRSSMRASLFSSDIGVLRHALRMHAIDASSLPIKTCRFMLINHLLKGACVDHQSDIHCGTTRRDLTACRYLGADFDTPADMSKLAIEIIVGASKESLPKDNLRKIVDALGIITDRGYNNNRRSKLLDTLKNWNLSHIQIVQPPRFLSIDTNLQEIETMPKIALLALAARHQLQIPARSKVGDIRSMIVAHITGGHCRGTSNVPSPAACSQVIQNITQHTDFDDDGSRTQLKVKILSSLVTRLRVRPLRRLLTTCGVESHPDASRSKLRRILRHHIKGLVRGKNTPYTARRAEADREEADRVKKRQEIIDQWPNLVHDDVKKNIIRNFRAQTSKAALSSFVCASCAEECLNRECRIVPLGEIDKNLLTRPDRRLHAGAIVDPNWLNPACTPPNLPASDTEIGDLLLHPDGVKIGHSGDTHLVLCRSCLSSLNRKKVPPLSIANHNLLGDVPEELKDLTVVEEAMIARCRAKCWIIQLKEEDRDLSLPDTQRGMRGHVIIYPQRPSALATKLPPSMEDVSTPICVVFVGSTPPSEQWLQTKAKPLIVRKEKVEKALLWLKEHNTHYKDILIDFEMLRKLPATQMIPVRVDHVVPNSSDDLLTSRYDHLANNSPTARTPSTEEEPPFQNVVVTDVDGHAPSNELRAAALRHVKKKGGAYIDIPHDPEPVNEFCNPDLFPMIYPCLFPYGIGGFENARRTSRLSLKYQVKHMFNLADRRFQEHYSFLFTTFNILQRRTALLHTSLKVRRKNFDSIAADFATVSPTAIQIVSERVARGDTTTVNNEEEKRVLALMRQVKLVTSHIPGSSASRVAMRNEIRGLMLTHGLPSFYVTINPADVYNPLVKFLAGSNIDVDKMLADEVPNYHTQSILVAKNPAVAAKFFNMYMKAFISAVLGFDPKQEDLEGGILGVVKAYYGCVESQGRGTLHCHMLIWIEGGLNPNEIKERALKDGEDDFRKRLLAFLDDTISTRVPDDPGPEVVVPSSAHHPCSVRGLDPRSSGSDYAKLRQKDLHHLASKCQIHDHSETCYKYWSGPPEPRECRFDLDESNFLGESTIDPDTGELCLRCLDGLVNNFNETILEAVRCNMDIKFIGSGASAKAILYYITDYITKSQLKAHVAFAALELAVVKLGEYDEDMDELTVRAKRMLQKCAHAMISHQELSAQMVCSYLMDFGDHYTSHKYHNVYWTSFESFINSQDPSPECYLHKQPAQSDALSQIPQEPIGDGADCDEDSTDDGTSSVGSDNDSDTGSHEETEHITDEEEDVGVSFDNYGQMIAKASQVADYQMRGVELHDISVWDFVRRVEKTRRDGVSNRSKHDPTVEADPEVQSDDESDVEESSEGILGNASALLSCKKRKRPRVEFLDGHSEKQSHILRIRAINQSRVPVPIGPSLPRRDRQDIKEKYCRLMLILFKPWRRALDLRNTGQSWSDAFDDFARSCSTDILAVMDNMQILHECKDSRDDHFSGRRIRPRHRSNRLPRHVEGGHDAEDGFGSGEEDEGLLMSHFEAMDNVRSVRLTTRRDVVDKCVQAANEGGVYRSRRPMMEDDTNNEEHRAKMVPDGDVTRMEDLWRKTYEDRRARWKRKHTDTGILVDNSPLHERQDVREGYSIRDASAFQTQVDDMEICLPTIRQDITASDRSRDVDISAIIEEYTLNEEQARAFRIVSEHSLEDKPEQLRMYLGGAGGTGKSRVINALRDFFERRNEGRRFRLASFTGVAARNISGMTLHSALNLDKRSKGNGSKAQHDQAALWEGVDYLFIDEVSMIGCKLLLQVSEALGMAKGNKSTPFGGVNVIFAGDFAQLPPVGQSRLFSHLNTATVGTKRGQDNVFGKLLWLSVRTVVLLVEVMRQSGSENDRFVELLGRLRQGTCTRSDFDLLNTRVIGNTTPDWSDPAWSGAPVIVSDNDVKDALNEKAAEAFAQQTGRELHWYYASDKRNGKEINDEALKTKLGSLHSGQTHHRLGKIPLVIGMPVMISQNFDVGAGVVNGCTGVLKDVRYRVGSDGRRHAISCVVYAPSTTGESLPYLADRHVVALEDSVDMDFVHPYSKRRCRVKRTQLPIIPAFAMTTHKAQGQTLSNVIIDIESCRGTEAPYVMVSRVKTLAGLLILRPFTESKITCRQSEDTRREMKRLQFLRLKTVMNTGTSEENVAALEQLKRAGFGQYMSSDGPSTGVDGKLPPGPRDIRRIQTAWSRLTDIGEKYVANDANQSRVVSSSVSKRKRRPDRDTPNKKKRP